ncbi:MAG: DEAD/DEAH box helicase [Gordonia sp. (in: high G+C Gram-positive bacteria)]
MPNPALRLSPGDLKRAFGAKTVLRGESYSRSGSIIGYGWSADGRFVSGLCRGSGNQKYRPVVTFAGTPSAASIVGATCTCPVAAFCKHGVALLLTISRESTVSAVAAPPRRDWRAILGSVAAPSTAEATAPLALWFALGEPEWRSRQRPLRVRPMTIGKRGTWIKTGASWNDVVSGYRGPFDATQVAALRDLYRIVMGNGPASHDWLGLEPAPMRVWGALREVRDSGVEFVVDPHLCGGKVEFRSAAIRYDFSRSADGGASMRAEIVVDDEPVDETDLRRLGAANPHGVWLIDGDVLVLAEFASRPTREECQLALSAEEIAIPAADLPDLATTVLPRLERTRTIRVDEGLFTPPTVSGPYAVLTLSPSGAGCRVSWGIGYHVDDVWHVVEVTVRAGDLFFRDADAENALWESIRGDVDAVAAVRDGTGTRAGLPPEQLAAPVILGELDTARLVVEVLPALSQNPAIVVDNALDRDFRLAETTPQIAFTADESGGNDWFSLGITITLGDVDVPLPAILAALSAGEEFLLLPDGTYFSLDHPELARLSELLKEAEALGEIERDRVSTASLNATLWEELLELGVVDKQLKRWRTRMAKIAAATPPRRVPCPRTVKATLRDYQRDGFDWLTFLSANGLGGILADDMGLGKTLQTLTMIARQLADDADARFLVIAPTSVVPNWVAECRRFVPSVRVDSVVATEARSETPVAEIVAGAQVVVTSYTLMRLLFERLDEVRWTGIIFDEAQFIKNHTGKTHQCARRLDADLKLAITGTPMENNLMELWALLSVTAPGLFPSPQAFTDYFRKPIESGTHPERMEILRRRIKPVMLRRRKDQVAIDLPPKQEQVMTLELGARHRRLYDARLTRERQKVLGLLGDWEKNRFEVFRSLSLLRQLSLHAALVDETQGSVTSAKVEYLMQTVPELVAEGHSALIFSQFTRFLDIVRSHLGAAGIEFSYLDGSMSQRKRAAAIADFTAGRTKVFLISLKAGGFGLNLTEADYCFVCDPWWNPAAEAQAVDRAHRIGQQRPVTVYRLVSADTIEEQVVALQDRKRALFDAAIDDGELFGSAITASDIREMIGA